MKKFIPLLIGITLILVGSWLWRADRVKAPSETPEVNGSATEPLPASSSPAPKVDQNTEWSLVAVGDIMLSRNVESTMLKQAAKYDYPYEKIKSLLKADIVMANLETPIIDGPPVPTGQMVFRSAEANLPALKKAGFTLVNLANNHMGDKGQNGVLNTLAKIDASGLLRVGASKTAAEAFGPTIATVNGYQVAFLGRNDHDVVPDSYGAGKKSTGEDWAGTALMQDSDITTEITNARTQADFVVLTMHSGTEYTETPNSHQTDFAHKAIDAGADIVIAHHPHVVQTVEKYKGKYIFYSLGNFVFDQMFSDETRRGLMLKLNFTGSTATQIELIPITIENYSQPRTATKAEAAWTLKRLQYPFSEQDGHYYLNLE